MTGSARRLSAIFRKEFRQIRRDPLSLALLIFVPALLLILYGYALSFDVKHIRTAVLDLDRTAQSRSLLTSLFENPYFDRAPDLTAEHDADGLLDRGRVKAVLVVPKGYAKSLTRGEEAKVQVLVDAADANTASAVIAYLEALSARATLAAQTDALGAAGGRLSAKRDDELHQVENHHAQTDVRDGSAERVKQARQEHAARVADVAAEERHRGDVRRSDPMDREQHRRAQYRLCAPDRRYLG
jgi:ABC-type Na+ efflux pump permease subunit